MAGKRESVQHARPRLKENYVDQMEAQMFKTMRTVASCDRVH